MLTKPSLFTKPALFSLGFAAFFVGISMSLFQIFVSLFMVLALIDWWLAGRPRVWNRSWLIVLAVFLAANAASLLASQYMDASAGGMFKVVRHLLFTLAIVWIVNDKPKFKLIAVFFMVGAAVACVDALIQAKTGFEPINRRKMVAYLVQSGLGRVTGPLRHANDFAAYLCLALFTFLAFFSARKYLPRYGMWLAGAGAILSSVCLVMTYSRGAWIAVVLAVALWAVFSKNRWMIGGLVALAIWAVFFSPDAIRLRLASFWDPTGGTVRERAALWGEAWRMIQAHPWIGMGVNTYARNEPHFKEVGSFSPDFQYAHNSFLQMGAEIGFIGLTVFLACMAWLFYIGFRQSVKSNDDFVRCFTPPLLWGIFAFLLHSATDTNLQSTLLVNAMWLCIGLVWALERISRENRTSS